MTDDTQPTVYKAEYGNESSCLVVATSFDDAVRKVHEYFMSRGMWPREAETPEQADRGEWAYNHVYRITRLQTLLIP